MPQGDDLVFPNAQGALMDDGNLRRRIFAPAARSAGVPWCGFHIVAVPLRLGAP